MIFPDLQPYSFPHVMYVSFFITHISIFWCSLLFIFVEGYSFNRDGISFMYKFANIILVISFIANLAFNANYAYLMRSPIMGDLIGRLPYPLYLAIAIFIYNISLWVMYCVGWSLKNKETNRLLDKLIEPIMMNL